MKVILSLIVIGAVLSRGDVPPDTGFIPPKESSCELPTWKDFKLRHTSVPEPLGGPEDSICNTTEGVSMVQVLDWSCVKKYCCEPPCNCSSELQTYMCDTPIPGLEPVELICLDLSRTLRFYRYQCCDGYMEEDHICVYNTSMSFEPFGINTTMTPTQTESKPTKPLEETMEITSPTTYTDYTSSATEGNVTILTTTPFVKEQKGTPSVVLIISILLGLAIIIIIVLVLAFVLYRRKKRRQFQKVIFSTNSYDNATYAAARASATDSIIENDMQPIPDKPSKVEIALSVDNFAINPLYERDKDIYEYSTIPASPGSEKSPIAEYLSSSPFVSGLPAYEQFDNKATYENILGDTGENVSLSLRHPLKMEESLENSQNDTLEETIYSK